MGGGLGVLSVHLSGSAEGVKDSILGFSGSGVWCGRKLEVWLGLAAAYSLEVVGMTQWAQVLPYAGQSFFLVIVGEFLPWPCFPQKEHVSFVVNFVLEVLLFATGILTAGGISSLSFPEVPS